MSLFYPLAYATGFTPWERAGEAERTRLNELFAREETERAGPGKALDLGCGSGKYTAELAARGWTVTGVDLIPRAVAQAQHRIEKLHLSASVLRADVTRLRPDQLGGGYDFFLDIGCYHGLNPRQRQQMAQGVTSLAADDATLLMLAFSRSALPRPLPRGCDKSDLEDTFSGWVVTDIEPASTAGMPKPLRKAAPMWYRLKRAAAATN
jgi:SAM-dependent methyltransferase